MSDSAQPRARSDAPVSSTAATLFDLRTMIAVLFGVYGLVLLIVGLVATDAADIAKAGGTNINLDTGIAMLIVAALFVLWVLLRPLRHPQRPTDELGPPGDQSREPTG
jgi:hypothetical protein